MYYSITVVHTVWIVVLVKSMQQCYCTAACSWQVLLLHVLVCTCMWRERPNKPETQRILLNPSIIKNNYRKLFSINYELFPETWIELKFTSNNMYVHSPDTENSPAFLNRNSGFTCTCKHRLLQRSLYWTYIHMYIHAYNIQYTCSCIVCYSVKHLHAKAKQMYLYVCTLCTYVHDVHMHVQCMCIVLSGLHVVTSGEIHMRVNNKEVITPTGNQTSTWALTF